MTIQTANLCRKLPICHFKLNRFTLYCYQKIFLREVWVFMEIYICDDSRPDLMRLAHHLKEYILNLDMHVEIRSFSSGESILAAYKRALVKPSLIFLDIYMGNMNGMDVARALRDDGFSGGIIFTTSSTAHAMDSYNVDALYYLQKPYDHKDFTNAINRCSSIFTEAAKTYTVSIRGKDTALPLKDILFFETGRHVTLVHTLTDTFSFTRVLTEIREDLKDCPTFLAVGRSYLVNRLYIREVTDTSIVMMNSDEIFIPVRLLDSIQAQISQDSLKSL